MSAFGTATYGSGTYTVTTPVDSLELRVVVQGKRHRVYVGSLLVIDYEEDVFDGVNTVGLYANGTSTSEVDDAYFQGV